MVPVVTVPTDPSVEFLGARLKDAARDAEVTPTELAAAMRVSASTLYRYYVGSSEPSYIEVIRAARLLGKPLAWFAGEAA